MSTDSTKEFELEGRAYYIKKMGGTASTKMLVRLTKLLGRPIISMMGSGDKKQIMNQVPAALFSLLDGTDEETVYALIKDLLKYAVARERGSTTVDTIYNEWFEDRIFDAFLLAKEVVDFNYSNFFERVASLLGKEASLTKGSPSQET